MFVVLLFPVNYVTDHFFIALMVTVSSTASQFQIHNMAYLFVSQCQGHLGH